MVYSGRHSWGTGDHVEHRSNSERQEDLREQYVYLTVNVARVAAELDGTPVSDPASRTRLQHELRSASAARDAVVDAYTGGTTALNYREKLAELESLA